MNYKTFKPQTFCEAGGCSCPTCHIGYGKEGNTNVEECIFCQAQLGDQGIYKEKDPVCPDCEKVMKLKGSYNDNELWQCPKDKTILTC